MALPPLVTVDDLSDWLGETIPADDARAGAVLSAASALVRAYTEQEWLSATDPTTVDVPDAVHAVTLAVAGRAWRRSGDVENTTETAGPFSYTQRFGGDGGGLYLTKTEKMMLRAHRVSQSSISVLSTTRGETDIDTVYVPAVGTDSVFPWLTTDDI